MNIKYGIHLVAVMLTIWVIGALVVTSNNPALYSWATIITDPYTNISSIYHDKQRETYALSDILILLNGSILACYVSIYAFSQVMLATINNTISINSINSWFTNYRLAAILVAVYPVLLVFTFITLDWPDWESPFKSANFATVPEQQYFYNVPNVTHCYDICLVNGSSEGCVPFINVTNLVCRADLKSGLLSVDINPWIIILCTGTILGYLPLLAYQYHVVNQAVRSANTPMINPSYYHSFIS